MEITANEIRAIQVKPKIAHVLSMGEYSGAEKIAIEICDYLKGKFDFIYICKPGGLTKKLKEKNIKYMTYESNLELVKILRNNDFNIVHAHDYRASIISSFFSRCKVISHIHNNLSFARSLNIKSILYYLATLKIEKVLCVSQCIEDEMYFKNLIGNKIEVAYNWINLNERLCNENIERTTDILFLSRFTEQKNPILFLDTINQIIKKFKSDLKVKMIGEGLLKEEALKYISNNNLVNNVEVLEFTEIPHKHMKEAKVFFVPSKWEGFGLVFLEALINGCIVIAPNVGGVPEIFPPNYSFLGETEDEYYSLIIRALSSKDSDEYMSSVKAEVKNKFDMDININNLKSIYDELVKN